MNNKRNWTIIKSGEYEKILKNLTVKECCGELKNLHLAGNPNLVWKAEPHIKIQNFFDEIIYAENNQDGTLRLTWICLIGDKYLNDTKSTYDIERHSLESGRVLIQLKFSGCSAC